MTSASPGAVSYSIASGPATVAGNTVSITGMGIVVIKATQAASGLYNATSATTSIAVLQQVPGWPLFHSQRALLLCAGHGVQHNGFVWKISSVVSGPATVSGNKVTADWRRHGDFAGKPGCCRKIPRCGRHNQLQREFLNALAGLHPDSPQVWAPHRSSFLQRPVAGRYHLQRHERSRIGGGQCGDSYGCR